MPFVAEIGVNRRLAAEGLDAMPATAGEVAGAAFDAALASNPTGLISRALDRQRMEIRTGDGYRIVPRFDEPGIYLTPEEANARYVAPGLSFTKPIVEPVARELYELKRQEIARNYVLRRSPGGFVPGAAAIAAGFGGSALDPLNIASGFIPVVGPLRYAGWLAGAGSFAGRTAVRAGVGAAEGAAGAALLEPFVYNLARAEQQDYTAADSLVNLAFGTVLGGGLHAVGGAVGELVGRTSYRTREDALRGSIADLVDTGSVGDAPGRALASDASLAGTVLPPGRAWSPSGISAAVRYEVVEAASLTVSHDAAGNVNAAFPAALQPRDRGKAESRAQIEAIAGGVIPERLGVSADTGTGAPIVGPTGVVESGNARAAALGKMYAERPDQAGAYRAWLGSQGFQTDGMIAPVLIRRRTSAFTADELLRWTVDSNRNPLLAQAAAERAMTDKALLDAGLLTKLRSGDISAANNSDFVRGFLDKLPQSEHGALSSEGRLTREGKARIEGAILARAYDDKAFLASALDAADPETRAIAGAMLDVAPAWAQLRLAAAEGRLAAGVDITPDLLAAVRAIDTARRTGGKLVDVLAQTDILGGELTEPARMLLRLMFRDDALARPKGREALAADLRDYAEQALRSSSEDTLFGGALRPVTATDILNRPRTDAQIAEDLARAEAELKTPAEALPEQTEQLAGQIAALAKGADETPAAPISPVRDATAGDALAQETAAMRARLDAAAERGDPTALELRAELDRLDALDAEAKGLGDAYGAAASCILQAGGA